MNTVLCWMDETTTSLVFQLGLVAMNTVLCWMDSKAFQPNDLLLFSTFIDRAIGAAAAHPTLPSPSHSLSLAVNLGVLCGQCRYLFST